MKTDPICESCHVKEIAYFHFLDKADLNELYFDKSCYFYKKGQVIFHQDSRSTGVFCLYKGLIKIVKEGNEGKEQVLRFVTPGELFGIRSFLGSVTYGVTAIALENCYACFINNMEFEKITSRYPIIVKSILTAMCDRLADAENKMTSLAQKPVRERLAETLVYLIESFEEKDPECVSKNMVCFSREDLANIVGCATETVIRLLSEFKEEGLIELKGRKILVKKINAFKEISTLYD